MEINKVNKYLEVIYKYTESADEKISQIRAFMDMYIESSKERGRMYGSISEIETQWQVLDHIYFILENVPNENVGSIIWGAFLSTKGYGSKGASTIFEEKNIKDPYAALVKLRNEYEEWRKSKIVQLKEKP